MKKIFIQKRITVVHSRPRKKSGSNNYSGGRNRGCFLWIALVALLGLSACSTAFASTPEYDRKTFYHDSLTNKEREIIFYINHDTFNFNKPFEIENELVLVLWIDKSYSVKDNNVPKMLFEQGIRLLNLIDESGNAMLAVGIIGSDSRSDLIFYNQIKRTLSIPTKTHGMTSNQYKNEIKHYIAKKNKMRGSSKNLSSSRKIFEKNLQRYLNYSKLHSNSQVCSAINVSLQLFKQPNNKNARKVILAITDGLNNGNEVCSWKLVDDIELVVVNRLPEDAFPLYDDKHYLDINSAIDYIITTY